MDRPASLLNADIQFLDTQVALVHIPLSLYKHFMQPILQLIALVGVDELDDKGIPRGPWAFYYPFCNISVNTIEWSIVCPRHLVQELFVPIVAVLDQRSQSQISISKDDFIVIQVGGQGMEAGQRVLDITAPLAVAGISIFFITSYYSDFVLVPSESKEAVFQALGEQGFTFHPQSSPHAAHMINRSSPLFRPRNASRASGFLSPTSPPPSNIAEWQSRTFATLRRNRIQPVVHRDMMLALCAGHRSDHKLLQDRLKHHLTACLVSVPPPRFLSLTLTDADSVSVTIEEELLSRFPDRGANILLRADEPVVPITLDLRNLPEESTGIVCGVAGRLIGRMHGRAGILAMTKANAGAGAPGFSMGYLSTAKAGTVFVREEEVEEALEALRELEESVALEDGHDETGHGGRGEKKNASGLLGPPSKPLMIGKRRF